MCLGPAQRVATLESYTPTQLVTLFTWYTGRSGRWPSLCRFLDCEEQRQTLATCRYSKHLSSVHELAITAQRKPYLPSSVVVRSPKKKTIWEGDEPELRGARQ